jgi:hypothetical protein
MGASRRINLMFCAVTTILSKVGEMRILSMDSVSIAKLALKAIK